MTVTPEGVESLSHEDAVVSFLIPDEPWDQNVIQGFCHFVLFFTSRGTGERWVAEHDGTLLLSVDDAEVKYKEIAETIPTQGDHNQLWEKRSYKMNEDGSYNLIAKEQQGDDGKKPS